MISTCGSVGVCQPQIRHFGLTPKRYRRYGNGILYGNALHKGGAGTDLLRSDIAAVFRTGRWFPGSGDKRGYRAGGICILRFLGVGLFRGSTRNPGFPIFTLGLFPEGSCSSRPFRATAPPSGCCKPADRSAKDCPNEKSASRGIFPTAIARQAAVASTAAHRLKACFPALAIRITQSTLCGERGEYAALSPLGEAKSPPSAGMAEGGAADIQRVIVRYPRKRGLRFRDRNGCR